MTGDNKANGEAQEKEKMRKMQLGVLNSEGVRNLYIAHVGKDMQAYGAAGKSATQMNYINALSNPDEHVSKITTLPYLQGAMEAQKNGQDIYESGVSASHATLLNNAAGVYQSAINKVKVSDVLGMLGLKNIHEKNLSKEDAGMFMEDFAKKNKDLYGMFVNTYFGTVQDTGVAQSLMENRAQQNKGLESILSQDSDKGKEELKLAA